MKTNNVAANAQIDHLVVAADLLSEGLHWCQNTLGIMPEPGGAHTLFGTHNLLVRLRSATHPLAYLEIIAIDPSVRPTRDRSLARWFDLDVPSIRQKLRQDGPQLVHWVARVPNITVAVAAWHALGIDRGQIIEASRPSPRGLLRWKITVRDDGQRLFGGALPTLIEWGEEHPALSMAEPVLALQSLRLQHPQAQELQTALATIGLDTLPVTIGSPGLFVELAHDVAPAIFLSHLEPT